MRERTLSFGSPGSLVGVLSEPEGRGIPNAPAVLLFNVGLHHHIGPHRLNVDLARRLALAGFRSLRFDLSGMGDSDPRCDHRSGEERAVLDLKEAMDLMGHRHDVEKFALVALCSGVDPAHTVAAKDSRVSAAAFLEGYSYRGSDYHLRNSVRRISRVLTPAGARRWIERRRLVATGNYASDLGAAIFDRTYPSPAQFKADVRRMLARDMRLLFMFTREAYGLNHVSQFPRMIGERRLPNRVQVEYLSAADHVFTSVAQRRALVTRIENWLSASYGYERGQRELEALVKV